MANIIYGTTGHDSSDLGGTDLIGTGQIDWIYGYHGDDYIEGRGGDDYLDGGSGTNTIKAGLGNDHVVSTGTSGWYNGAAGIDLLDFGSMLAGGAFDLAAGAGRFGADTVSGPGAFTMLNFESIKTGFGNDDVWGTEGENTIQAGGGNDNIYGRGGNDTVEGGAGNDYLDGGLGNDLLSGGEGADTIYGNAGTDELVGGNGADELYGGDGGDWLTGGAGADLLDGLSGFDTMSFAGLTNGVVVNGAQGTASSWNGSAYEVDTFYRIENIIGTSKADTMVASDTMSISGGSGDDMIYSADGANVLSGGSGKDTASYLLSTAAVNVNLAAGTASGGWASGDALSQFENLIGSNHNDTLRAANAAATLRGAAGDDKLFGGNGADRIYGDLGGDELTGGAGADHFVFAAKSDSPWPSNDQDTILDFTKGIDKIDLSGLDANTYANGDQAFDNIFLDMNPYMDSRFDAGAISYWTAGGNTYVALNMTDKEEGQPNSPYDAIEMAFTIKGNHTLELGDFIL